MYIDQLLSALFLRRFEGLVRERHEQMGPGTQVPQKGDAYSSSRFVILPEKKCSVFIKGLLMNRHEGGSARGPAEGNNSGEGGPKTGQEDRRRCIRGMFGQRLRWSR